jgi:hypothetical protein
MPQKRQKTILPTHTNGSDQYGRKCNIITLITVQHFVNNVLIPLIVANKKANTLIKDLQLYL